ncbi:LANO_0D02894g1_1 [Lachancea nothofagi CBS 11611]|uniref:LANO_0D02894g1_1 n=1 Tax=Lachancea nothofagi CBS 11611 TaxID=1266666 RepID=A0A1G4JET6_9SACH|nr:LANO_0D02894g1_1 [Lachancea nothofagi CBS 11611]
MIQLITTPAILLVSTVIPLQFTIEYLNLSGSGPEPNFLGLLLLKFWCLHAMTRAIPNPLVYIFQSLPLSNIVELGAWLVVTRELVSQFSKLEASRGHRIGGNASPASGEKPGWITYFQSISNPPPTDRYVFGQFTFLSIRTMEKWPLDLQILDSSFHTVMAWIAQIRSKNPAKAPESRGWNWSYQWFAGQTTQRVTADEDYDLMEDVIEDIKKS